MKVVETDVFVDRWAAWGLLVPVVAMALFLPGLARQREVWSGNFTLSDEGAGESPPIVLPRTAVGAIRIDARGTLKWNHWAAYKLSVLDRQRTPLLEVVKEMWAENGVWHEDGESGRWEESDTDLAWDMHTGAEEPVIIQLEVLETSDAAGNDVDFFFPLEVRVLAGVVDSRFLLLGLVLSGVLTLLAQYLAGHGGRPVIVEQPKDSEAQGRAVMGGPGKLVSVSVAGLVDDSPPRATTVRVILRDDQGREIYDETHPVTVKYRRDEDKVLEDGSFRLRLYFELPSRASHAVFVRAAPDEPMEWLKLIVRDGATTRGKVAVILPDDGESGPPSLGSSS